MAAAERILEQDGVPGLTLRAAAREAGASHAAPKNHFGDLTGLLSELAAVGFRRFTNCLRIAASAETAPRAKLVAIGRAYVQFAVANPGLFQLMFRGEKLDVARPALRDAIQESSSILPAALRAMHPDVDIAPHSHSLPGAAQMVGVWSRVHGFAMLLLDGRLAPILERLPRGTDATMLLDEMLNGPNVIPPPEMVAREARVATAAPAKGVP